MYNMIHANQQDIQWKKYSLFSVYQVDKHETYRSKVFLYVVVHSISSSASIY